MKKIFVLLILLLMPIKVLAMGEAADAAILMDADSGRILFAKNIDKQKLIASTTKIMTAVIAIETNRLDEVVTIGEEVTKSYGSSVYLEMYEQLKLKDLLYGLLLRSGNDAAVAIATFVSGSEEEFVKKMNEKAKEIGMINTYFNNASGLDDYTENKSTARDMALLEKYALTLKDYVKISGTKKYVTKSNLKDYIWTNKNKLLKMYKYAKTGKPGFTDKANRTLVTSASKGGMNLIVVTLDDGNDFNDHIELFDYGFKNYKNYTVLNKKNFKVDSPYYLDRLYLKYNFYYPLTEQEKDQIKIRVELAKKKYSDKDSVGDVIVNLGQKEIYRDKIYVSVKNKNLGNWFSRLISSIL